MIFASLGTMDMPFVRMAKAVDNLAEKIDEEVIVQTGYTSYDYKHAKAFDFCTKDEMRSYISDASIIVLQGGWGTISEAIEMRKRIIVIPRYDKIEHIHDQIQLVEKLDELSCVIYAKDENDLPAYVAKARDFDFKQIAKGNAERLIRNKLEEWF